MPFHNQEQETLDRDGLARLQKHKLSAVLSEVSAAGGFWANKYAGISLDAVPLGGLPLITRGDLERDQQADAPYGTVHTLALDRYRRFHQTSGSTGTPLRCLDTAESWRWWKHCWSIVYRGGGLVDGDRLMFPFSFGPFVGFWAAFEAAADLGNLCLAAGGMTTAARLRYMLDNAVTVVCCTPTYALHMAEVAAGEGIDLAGSPVRLLVVAGEPGGSISPVRRRLESSWGARVIDHAGMTEIGAWGFECAENPGGLHVIESEFIAEVIDPSTSEPVDDGEAGELVLTNLGRVGLPLIRYRTGDRVTMTHGQCKCGRWFARVEGGITGRFDDMLVVRGNNVFPSAVEAIVREFNEVVEFRMSVERGADRDDLRLEIEAIAGQDSADLAKRVESAIRDRLHLKPIVELVKSGVLPRFEMKAKRVVQPDEIEKQDD